MRRYQYTKTCRLIGAFGCCLVLFSINGALAADLSPYEARVSKAGAPIYSGPGENFYPTDTLAQGEVVEIYREKPDGWCAIRPPKNNFSWVYGRDVKLTEKGIGEVASNGAPSRIGSRINDRRNAVQVQLKQGEAVEILDEETIAGEVWYKISPPAGEFRWIHASCIDRNAVSSKPESNGTLAPLTPLIESGAPTTTDSATKAAATEPIKDANSAAQTATTAQWQATTPDSGDPGKTAGDVSAPPLASTAPTSDMTPPAKPTEPSNDTNVVNSSQPPAAATASEKASPTQSSSATVNDDLARQLTGIELRLSRMVAAPPQQWNTESLEHDAQQLLAKSQTTAERDAIKVTMDKLDRFASIGRRYNGGDAAASTSVAGMAASPAASAVPIMAGAVTPVPDGGATTATASTTAETTPESGRYDAVGVLRPVVSKRPGAPQFALVDERGQVISFVSSTPDVNLQPYLGRRVGVVGNRGFIPEFQRAHVTAGRIQPLGDRILR